MSSEAILNFNKTEDGKEQKLKKGIFLPSISEHREKLTSVKPLLYPADVQYIDIIVPINDNVKIPARIYIPPKKQNSHLPTLFYIPGTAFIAHESQFTKVICSHVCLKAECQVIVINHRLAPENQFPIGYQDTYDVFKFFVEKMPDSYLIDKKRIAIAGYSSGGNFAALLTIQAKDEGINIARQILISPIVDLSRSLSSKFSDFEKKDTDITEEFVTWFINLYLPEKINPRNPNISPFWQNETKIKNLPPTDIIVAQYDRFRGDAESYYLKLKEAGVDVSKDLALEEKHSYLWYKQEVVDKISEKLKNEFEKSDEENNINQHTLSTIKPNDFLLVNNTVKLHAKL